MFVYWNGNYWQANYWQSAYWQAVASANDVNPDTPSLTLTAYGPQVAVDLWDYFSDDYFAPNYWQADYWGESNAGGGGANAVEQLTAGSLTLTEFPTFAGLTTEVSPPTETLTLSALVTDAANDITVSAALPTLTLSAFNVNTDNAGYVEGDIDLNVYVASTFSFTDGVNVTLPTLTFTAPSPVGVEEQGATAVTVQSTPALALTAYPTNTTNPKNVQPLTPSLTLTEYPADAGFGRVISAGFDTLTLTPISVSAFGVPVTFGQIFVGTPRLRLTEPQASVSGLNRTVPVPESTFVIDNITNADATTDVPSNYLICDRTGFKIPVSEGLREEWDGTMVRAKSFEAKHPQEFVRSRPDRLDGSERPEQDDEFISELYPTGVSADDL